MLSSERRLLERARSRIGTVLTGKYRLDQVLGVGGMAAVFGATHLRNGSRVAVKVLHRELSPEPSLRARFLREGHAANLVGHPGAVRILDDDVAEDGSVFLVMELLDGETLDARWERGRRRLPVPELLRLMSELLDVLGAAHAKGIIHRDLKPENLFITRDGHLRVLDFGVARLREASAKKSISGGGVLGTPAFMPPEQALGRADEIDARSDIWTVGATAFMLLAGRPVHDGETVEHLLVQAATTPAPLLSRVAPWVPDGVADVIDRALAFEKAKRWTSARAMRDALIRVQDDGLDHTNDDGETLTFMAGAPTMTLGGVDELEPDDETIALPRLPPRLSLAGMVTPVGQRRRARRNAMTLGAAAGCAIAVVGLAFSLRTSGRPPAQAPTAGLRGARLAETPVVEPAVPAPDVHVGSLLRVISVEDLPRATDDATPALGMQPPRVPSATAAHPPSAPAPSAAPSVAPSAGTGTTGPDGF